MKHLYLIFSVLSFFAQSTWAVGFSTGSEFKVTLIQGRLTYICPNSNAGGQQQIVHFICRSTMLEPVEYDYFVGPVVDGNNVTLNVTREDGSSRSKTTGYNGAKGRSDSRFNLWISSLTQRPLLADGVNKVAYKITKGSAAVTVGEFTANVIRQPIANCSDRTMYGSFPQDCQNQMTACGRYFEDQNYCH